MYYYHNKKKLIWSIILILLLVIGIGYAYLTSNLSISGNTQVTTNTWNIHFENLNVSTGSVTTSSPAAINASGDAISYTINLNRPKEYYEFTVDVKNAGTLPGVISVSTLSGLDTISSKIIDYTIKYTNGNSVNIGDIINAGAKKSIKVRVFYKDEIDPTDFPATDLNLTLTYTLQYVQSESDETSFFENLIDLSSTNSCITKYNGNVTDKVNETKQATNVYFDNCSDKRHVIFNNMCWEVFRTTDSKGVKIIYNGDAVDGKCESTRANHIGINGYYGSYSYLTSEYTFGSSFTYDKATKKFNLNDKFNAIWNDSTYEDLIAKYTCLNNTGSNCNKIYFVGLYKSNDQAYTVEITVGNTLYFATGTSPFNAYWYGIDMLGYMFNNIHNTTYVSLSDEEYKYGSSFSYDPITNKYTLAGTTETITNWGSNYSNAYNKIYTCFNTSGECTSLLSLIKINNNGVSYLELHNGNDIEDEINDILTDEDNNKYDSAIKSYLDNWYANNMTDYTSYIEDNVYCNNKSISEITNYGMASNIKFKPYELTSDLSCNNLTDQFSLSNNKAKLKYSIGLVTVEELVNLTDISLMAKDRMIVTNSPFRYDWSTAYIFGFNNSISHNENNVYSAYYIRPMISLNKKAVVSKGTGTETNPWIIE